MSDEDEILNRIAAEQTLERLSPEHADMLRILFEIERPADWEYGWPPTYDAVGKYIGLKYQGRVLSESTMRLRFRQLCPYATPRRKRTQKSQ